MKDRLTMEEKLAAYIEGTLSEEEKSIIEEQLKESEEMRETLSDLRKTIQLLQGLEEVETPNWFTEKIMSRVREGTEQKKGIFERLFFTLHIKLPIQVFAVIILAAWSAPVPKPPKSPPHVTVQSRGGVSRMPPRAQEVWGDI